LLVSGHVLEDGFEREVNLGAESASADLAGAQFSPTGGNTMLTGNIASNQLAGQSLASLGYGARQIERYI